MPGTVTVTLNPKGGLANSTIMYEGRQLESPLGISTCRFQGSRERLLALQLDFILMDEGLKTIPDTMTIDGNTITVSVVSDPTLTAVEDDPDLDDPIPAEPPRRWKFWSRSGRGRP
jgi:hypothetical protein